MYKWHRQSTAKVFNLDALTPAEHRPAKTDPVYQFKITLVGSKYEYHFGDGWQHEVLFEGSPPVSFVDSNGNTLTVSGRSVTDKAE